MWPIVTLTEIHSDDQLLSPTLYNYDVGFRSITLKDGSNWRSPNHSQYPLDGRSIGTQYLIGRFALEVPITLTGTFGYATPPAAVRMACCKIAAERVGMDGTRISLLDERLPNDAVDLLKRYTRLIH